LHPHPLVQVGLTLDERYTNGMDRILSAAYQKDRARRRAFHQWELDYHLAKARNDLQINATGLPLDGAAYQYAISQPPSEVNHPLWSMAVTMEKDERGRKTRRPLFLWQTTSTALQLAVDHAFTGSYARKLRPLDPPVLRLVGRSVRRAREGVILKSTTNKGGLP
jgi:hypothetical protein